MILNIYPDDEDNYDQVVYDDGELLDDGDDYCGSWLYLYSIKTYNYEIQQPLVKITGNWWNQYHC